LVLIYWFYCDCSRSKLSRNVNRRCQKSKTIEKSLVKLRIEFLRIGFDKIEIDLYSVHFRELCDLEHMLLFIFKIFFCFESAKFFENFIWIDMIRQKWMIFVRSETKSAFEISTSRIACATECKVNSMRIFNHKLFNLIN